MDQLLVVNKIALDEKEEEDEGRSAAEIEEEMREKEAKAQAQILEMVSDIDEWELQVNWGGRCASCRWKTNG